jgi:outer membrane protein TolC
VPLQLNGSWELDFFGKNRTAIEAAIGSDNAAAADADAARVLLASNVARELRAVGAPARSAARRRAHAGPARRTLQAGARPRLRRPRHAPAVAPSEGGLPEARQQIESLSEQIAIAQHALDALVASPQRTRRSAAS